MTLFVRERSRIKRSVDLSPWTDEALDDFRALSEKRGLSLSRGAAIDAVLGAVLRLSPEQAAHLRDAAGRGLETSLEALDATSRDDIYTRREAAENVARWEDAIELFDIIADDYEQSTPMRSIQMHGKRLLIPDSPDWISINEGDAARSTVATIVEVKNGAQFDSPHFVYFDDGETTPSAIDAAILAIYPSYADILAARVKPIRDADGRYLNREQLQNAPDPGYYPAQPHDPVLGDPYGVVIISEKGESD